MIKLLLVILVLILLAAFSYSALSSDKPISLPGSQNSQTSSPADAIQGAKEAVQQRQGVQDRVNNYAQDQ